MKSARTKHSIRLRRHSTAHPHPRASFLTQSIPLPVSLSHHLPSVLISHRASPPLPSKPTRRPSTPRHAGKPLTRRRKLEGRRTSTTGWRKRKRSSTSSTRRRERKRRRSSSSSPRRRKRKRRHPSSARWRERKRRRRTTTPTAGRRRESASRGREAAGRRRAARREGEGRRGREGGRPGEGRRAEARLVLGQHRVGVGLAFGCVGRGYAVYYRLGFFVADFWDDTWELEMGGERREAGKWMGKSESLRW
jgi:hypothetical protein